MTAPRMALSFLPFAMTLAMCGTFSGVSTTPTDAGSGDAEKTDGNSVVAPASDASDLEGGAFAAYATLVLSDNPLLYFHLEETTGATAFSAVDASPSAQIVGGPVLGVIGKVGRAYAFPGNSFDAFLQITDANLGDAGFAADEFQFTGTQPFSLEAWVYLNSIDATFRHVFVKDTTSTDARNEYGIWVRNENGAYHAGFERYSNGVLATGIAPITLFAWHHLVGVYDGKSDTLWIDGQNAASGSDLAVTGAKNGPLLIGAKQAGCCEFPGTIDEVAIYDHALNPAQIAAHYQAGF